ncbi:bifunctional diguanylate cyclase/phosphodiesterase [Variibacter gotjawalensis]|nr:bifunctional diguanylate cyclase/phosphodiesterase [Variibacter gotjawalensis]NIK48616.1 diguanylate cyclase (GGDEF)-like protein [Variibacter gotjawalensis]
MAAQQTEPKSAEILSSVGFAAYEWDLRTDAIRWDRNAANVLTIDPSEITSGRNYARYLCASNASTPYDAVMQSGRVADDAGVPYEVVYLLTPEVGVELWIEDRGRWFVGMDGRPSHAHGVVRVVTENHKREQNLVRLSKFDALTGEANRWHLMELVSAAAADAARINRSCAFMLVAIDNLSLINESLGFQNADQVIAAVAKRLRERLRAGDVLGRFSGNKFGLLLQNCKLAEMDAAAQRLISGVGEHIIETPAGSAAVTVTIAGVSIPRHGREALDIIERAQDTLATAKKSKGPGSFLAYRPNLERDALRRKSLAATDEIVAALNERRFHLAFEPIVNGITRLPDMYECLTRVTRADGSIASAGAIIPIAEKLGLIRLIDQRLVELVVSELTESRDINLTLNVSALSVGDAQWWDTLRSLLRANPGAGQRLTVEITETTAMQNVEDVRGFVTRVKDLGCKIAIDDFGSGYTSFRNLRLLGVDVIKIDGAFVQNLSRSADDRAFANAMIWLGHSLGLKTIAEWVQDEPTAKLLTGFGCHYLQGELVGLASSDRPWLAGFEKRAAVG